jgi:hypothetical protein
VRNIAAPPKTHIAPTVKFFEGILFLNIKIQPVR